MSYDKSHQGSQNYFPPLKHTRPTTESSKYMAQKIRYSVSDIKGQPLIVSCLLMSQYTFSYLVILCIGNSEMTGLTP